MAHTVPGARPRRAASRSVGGLVRRLRRPRAWAASPARAVAPRTHAMHELLAICERFGTDRGEVLRGLH